MTYFVRASALTNYARVARDLGLDPYRQLRKAGIPRGALFDPGATVSASALRKLLAASAEAAGVEDFGLRMAETRQLTDLGPLGLAIQGAPTLRNALESLERYLRLQSETVVMSFEEIGDLLVIRQNLLADDQPARRQSIELVVGGLYRLLQRFLGDRWKPRSICFTHPPPSSPTRHTSIFGMHVLFNQEFDGIVCRSADLAAPLADYDPQLASEVKQHLDAQLAGATAAFPEVVRRLILARLGAGACTAENIAEQLTISRRTLHRRLLQHGHRFSDIQHQARLDQAAQLVSTGARPLAELAMMLGFGSASSFARWFGSCFGCTVSSWRKQRQSSQVSVEPGIRTNARHVAKM